MRGTLIITMVLVLLPLSFAQERRGQASAQTIFNYQAPFERQIRLPDPVLNILRNDEKNRQSFDKCQSRGKVKEIPAKWFTAAEISLQQDVPPAIIVRADNACLTEPNTAPFWVVRRTGTDYQLVFTDTATSLVFQPIPSDGFPHIECRSELAGVSIVREFEYKNDTYTLTSKRVEAGQWLAPS